jgi:hypothetical protein
MWNTSRLSVTFFAEKKVTKKAVRKQLQQLSEMP